MLPLKHGAMAEWTTDFIHTASAETRVAKNTCCACMEKTKKSFCDSCECHCVTFERNQALNATHLP